MNTYRDMVNFLFEKNPIVSLPIVVQNTQLFCMKPFLHMQKKKFVFYVTI